MLLPPAFQDKTQFLPLGKKVEKPEPAKECPLRAFERAGHFEPVRSLMRDQRPLAERQAAFAKTSEILERSINGEYDPPAWDHIANRRAWAELNVEYDAEMAKARARLIGPGSIEDIGLKDGDVVTMACFPGKTYTIADLTESSVSSVVAEFKASQFGIKQRGYPLRGEWLRKSVANAERKLDWPKLNEA